jgi:molecular chaperone GrpE (heat shock protein)
MTKEEVLAYLSQAIEAMDDRDIDELFPSNAEPDLYTIVEELVGLRGEVKKLSQSALRNNQDVQTLINKQSELAKISEEQFLLSRQPTPEEKMKNLEEEYRDLLLLIIDYDDIMQRTWRYYEELPELGYLNMNAYKTAVGAWGAGYAMAHSKWNTVLKSTGMVPTGKVGEIFNPEYQEAVATSVHTSMPDNAIVSIEVLGFMSKQKVVRRAKVIVNKLNK